MPVALIYHHHERELADEWADELRSVGYKVTLAPLGFEVGSPAWQAQARSDLEAADVALVLSTRKARADQWVNWRCAVVRQSTTPLIPVVLDQFSSYGYAAPEQHVTVSRPRDKMSMIAYLVEHWPPPPPPTLCFISYARSEREFAVRLAADLRAHQIQVWRDEDDIAPGASWARQIQRALIACTHVLLVTTPRSVESPNVLDEVEFALDRNKIVVPLWVQECELPLRIHRAQRIDFRASYPDGLDKLLAQLRAGREAPPMSAADTGGPRSLLHRLRALFRRT